MASEKKIIAIGSGGSSVSADYGHLYVNVTIGTQEINICTKFDYGGNDIPINTYFGGPNQVTNVPQALKGLTAVYVTNLPQTAELSKK